MSRVFDWIKNNKLVALLILVVLILLAREGGVRPLRFNATKSIGVSRGGIGMAESGVATLGMPVADMMYRQESFPGIPVPPIVNEVAPTDRVDRLVIKDTSMSVVVKDVKETITKIEAKASELGGFLVDANLNVPEGAASGTITVRVPEEKRTEALEAFRGFGVRVVNENVNGRDVTDQYVDIEARLAVLTKTKQKFEQIMDQAVAIDDLLNVQRELVNLQSQIDNLKGQQQYLEQSAKLTKITVYLSTDELALPYAPDEVWRPKVVFKLAVRSLVGTFRGLANWLIWAGVYALIWVPILIAGWVVYRKSWRRPM